MYNVLTITSIMIFFLSILILYAWRHNQSWWLPKKHLNFFEDLLPFYSLQDDGKTVQCKDGTIFRLLRIQTIDYSIFTADKITVVERNRQKWLDNLAEHNASFRIFCLRNREIVDLDGDYPDDMLRKIHDTWMHNFKRVYKNQHFLMISVPGKTKRLKKEAGNISQLNKLVDITKDLMFDLNPIELGKNELMKNLNSIVNLQPQVSSRLFTNNQIEFLTDGYIIINYGDNVKYIKVISIKWWPEDCCGELLEEIMGIDSELLFFHMLQGISLLKAIAPNYLPHQSRQAKMFIGGNEASREYEAVINRIKSGESTLYNYQLCIFVIANNKEDSLARVRDIKKLMHQKGVEPVVAGMSAQWIYQSMFPSNEEMVYLSRLESNVLAHWINFSGEARGFANNDWGNGPIRYFPTGNKSSYALQLHNNSKKDSLAHSLVIAPSESGKTTFFQHLIGGVMRYNNINSYIFDRLRGTQIFTEATGGEYIALDNRLNPFCCDDTKENRIFLQNLLLMMSGHKDDYSIEMVSKAIDIMFHIPIEHRILTNCFDEIIPDSDLKRGLKIWTGNNSYGHWFNGVDSKGNARDSLILNNHIVAFDMTEIQQYPMVAATVTYYITHKIRQQIQESARPHMIFIDETGPQLQNEQFCDYVAVLFREHRKLRGSINACFQEASQLTKSPIASAILNNCPTKFLFPSPNSKREDYHGMRLTDFEWAYIKNELPICRQLKHSVLVKKEKESVILDIDLSGMGNLLKLYKSDSASVKLVKELKEKYHNINWQEHYLVNRQ